MIKRTLDDSPERSGSDAVSQPSYPEGASARAERNGFFGSYVFVDWVTQVYIALIGLLVLSLHGSAVPRWKLIVVVHVVALVLIHLLIRVASRYRSAGVLDFLRHFYPVLLYLGFYSEIGLIDHMLFDHFLDPFFIQIDIGIFGSLPSLLLVRLFPYRPLSELFYAAYFSYYVMIGGMGLYLFLRDRSHFFHFVSVVTLAFCCCYLLYILFPVLGPRIFVQDPGTAGLPSSLAIARTWSAPDAVKGGLFFRLMGWIYRTFETKGAAFPSSHVVIALVTLRFSFRYLRPIRFVHLAVVVLLCLSTVYCRYHYAIDVAGGLVAAAILIPLGDRLCEAYPADA